MRYAVYALGREYGPDDGADHGADQDFYRILRKPPYEAFKAYQVMRHEWGMDVIPVCPDRATILGDPCYPSLHAAPHPVDCVVSFLPSHFARTLAGEMREMGTPVLWRMFGPIINGFDNAEHDIYRGGGHPRRQWLRPRPLGCRRDRYPAFDVAASCLLHPRPARDEGTRIAVALWAA